MTEHSAFGYKHPHPAVAADLAIFSLRAGHLELLLVERGVDPYRGKFALPGGFLRIQEDLIAAAQRELREETGITHAYLEQVGAFGRPDRDPRERVISIAFFAILSADKVALAAGSDASAVSWHRCNELPPLAFDHSEIVNAARQKLTEKISRSTLALEFLPAEFTLTDLQQVFEAVRGERIDKRNFRKWSESLAFIKPTGKMRRGAQHRPAALFRASGKRVLTSVTGPGPSPAAAGESVMQGAVSDAYRKGYEDAISALHRSILETERSLLKSLNR